MPSAAGMPALACGCQTHACPPAGAKACPPARVLLACLSGCQWWWQQRMADRLCGAACLAAHPRYSRVSRRGASCSAATTSFAPTPVPNTCPASAAALPPRPSPAVLALVAKEGLQSAAALVYLEASEHYKQRNLLEGGMYSFTDLDAEDEQVLMQGVQLEAQQAAGAAGGVAAGAAADAADAAGGAADSAAAAADCAAAAAVGDVQAAAQVATEGGLSEEAALHPPLATFISNTFGFTVGQSSETACTCCLHIACPRVMECSLAVACQRGVWAWAACAKRPNQSTLSLHRACGKDPSEPPLRFYQLSTKSASPLHPTAPALCHRSEPDRCAAAGHSPFRGDSAGQLVR